MESAPPICAEICIKNMLHIYPQLLELQIEIRKQADGKKLIKKTWLTQEIKPVTFQGKVKSLSDVLSK